MEHGAGFGSGCAVLRVQAEVRAFDDGLADGPLHRGSSFPGDLACVQIRGQIGAGKQVLAEIGCVTVENFGEFLAGNGLFRVFAVGNAVSGGPIAAGFVPG